MKITILGSGTSAGVPTLGCRCEVCLSTNPMNKRMRATAFVEINNRKILIDCGPDFRTQAMKFDIQDVDCLLLTHTHADHVNGVDDLRSYNMIHDHSIPIYAQRSALDDLRVRFAYCFAPPPPGGGIPRLDLVEICPAQPFEFDGIAITPLPIYHGTNPILGFRIGSFSYITDVSRIPDETWPLLKGTEILVTGALRHTPHPTHMSLSEGVEVAKRVGARQTWFIHMCHDLEHEKTNAELPPGIALAYDGLTLELS